jgi:ribosome-associated translation inhibitor RaiA
MVLKEFAQENNIKILGFPELDEIDEQIALKTVQENFEKISRTLPEFTLVLQAKEYNKAGARKQHELHARLAGPKGKAFSTALEWNFLTSLQKCLKELRQEVKKIQSKK